MVEFAWVYESNARHDKGQCWNSNVFMGDLAYPIGGKRAYYYDCPAKPGKLLYCEDCLREMGVLW